MSNQAANNFIVVCIIKTKGKTAYQREVYDMKLSEAGQRVFDARYAMRDDQGNIIETFDQAVERLAWAAASAEKENQVFWQEKFSSIIGDLLFVPSTPIWANVGKPDRPWQPSACFVLDVEDSL